MATPPMPNFPTIPTIPSLTDEQRKALGRDAEATLKQIRDILKPVAGNLAKWQWLNSAHQLEYFSLQAVKVDLDGLAITDEGLTLFGAKIGNSNPLKAITQKWIDKGWEKVAQRFQGRLARQIFDKFAPESVHQARIDAAQDEKILLAKASLGGRITILEENLGGRISQLAGNVARIAELQATEARRGSNAATERSRHFINRNRGSDRQEAEDLRKLATELDKVKTAAQGLTTTLV